jgi:predicted DNA-binding transcriptional regulator YafY
MRPEKPEEPADEQDKAVLDILSRHNGFEHAISRTTLLNQIRAREFTLNERMLRRSIYNLRRQGHLICSRSGNDGGYYMATTYAEYESFRRAEYASKISDMAETMKIMDAHADEQFIQVVLQPRLL